jgi:hypothetical protein
MSAKCFTVSYERSDVLGFRTQSKAAVRRCIVRMGALYSFNFSLKVEEFTYRSIAAIKQSRSCYTINCDTFIVLLLFLFKDLLLISRCSDPLEMLVLYNHKNKMIEESMVRKIPSLFNYSLNLHSLTRNIIIICADDL